MNQDNNQVNIKNEVSQKRHYLVALIVTLSLVIIAVSGSYAYYVNAVKNVNEDNQGVNITSNGLTINFNSTNTLTADSMDLIKDEEVKASDYHTDFNITFPSDSKVNSAAYNLYLTDIKMTNNYKSADLKWALYDSSSDTTPVATGDFSGASLSETANEDGTYDALDLSLVTNKNINKGDTVSYKLYVWLSYKSDVQQSNLLNGSMSMKVGFNAVSK